MLKETRFTITSKSFVNEEEIASFGAVIDVEKNDMSFFTRQINKEACKEYRDEVRADQAEFEDFAYAVQENVKAMTGVVVEEVEPEIEPELEPITEAAE